MWEVVGILEPEERVYEALIPLGWCTVTDLAAKTRLSSARTSRILRELVSRGLATRLPGKPARFFAVKPDLAVASLIAAQESKLGQLREYAEKRAASYQLPPDGRPPADRIEVVEGPENVRDAFARLQREAHREMRIFDKPLGAEEHAGNSAQSRPSGNGHVSYRTVYDKAGLIRAGRMTEIRKGIRHGDRARVGSVPMRLALSDDRLALMPVMAAGAATDQAAYVVRPSSLLDALSELFELIWAAAVPLNQRPPPAAGSEILTDQDRDILGLLAAGSTDEMMARTFGWSVRTVQRHVHRIMNLLNVDTRFQAGLEAGRRGWI